MKPPDTDEIGHNAAALISSRNTRTSSFIVPEAVVALGVVAVVAGFVPAVVALGVATVVVGLVPAVVVLGVIAVRCQWLILVYILAADETNTLRNTWTVWGYLPSLRSYVDIM